MATWPSTLPAPRRTGLSITLSDNTMRRQTQSQRTEVRRFGSGAPDQVRMQIKVAIALVDILEQFYNVDLNRGKNWFDAYWITGADYLGYPDHKGRLAAPPEVKVYGARYRIYSLTVLIKKSSNCPADTSWPSWIIGA